MRALWQERRHAGHPCQAANRPDASARTLAASLWTDPGTDDEVPDELTKAEASQKIDVLKG
jgi:hypothetical protein